MNPNMTARIETTQAAIKTRLCVWINYEYNDKILKNNSTTENSYLVEEHIAKIAAIKTNSDAQNAPYKTEINSPQKIANF